MTSKWYDTVLVAIHWRRGRGRPEPLGMFAVTNCRLLIKHLANNEITAYRWFSYKDPEDVFDDKMTVSGQYKGLRAEISTLRKELKTWLLKEHLLDRKIIEKSGSGTTAEQKKTRENITGQIQIITYQLQDKEAQRQQTEK